MINIPPLDLVLVAVLFGPSALSLAFSVMGRKFVQNARLRSVCVIIAFLLLVVQGRWLLRAMLTLFKGASHALPMLFTLAASVGFIVSVAFWVKYSVRRKGSG
jgi:cation transport ATPase